MQRARQVIERAANNIAQNYDNELLQARSMLSGLMSYAQDTRYRTVVNDLLTRYIERAVAARRRGRRGRSAGAAANHARRAVQHRRAARRDRAAGKSGARAASQRTRLRLLGMIGGDHHRHRAGRLSDAPDLGSGALPVANADRDPDADARPTFTPSATFTPSETPTPAIRRPPRIRRRRLSRRAIRRPPSNTPTDTPTPTEYADADRYADASRRRRASSARFSRRRTSMRARAVAQIADVFGTIPVWHGHGRVWGSRRDAAGWPLVPDRSRQCGRSRSSGVYVRDDSSFVGQFQHQPCPPLP